jgi:putative transposase
MGRVIFSEKDILNLSKNHYVLSISKKTITYTNEFRERFINEYLAGKMPIQIFEDAGFDMDIIGYQRIDSSCQRWREAYEKKGIIGLIDARKTSSRRTLTRDLTQEEIIERQEAKIKLLEAQVELLKKLEVKERMLINKGKKLKSSDIFQLINESIIKHSFKNLTSYLCEISDVSRSGYYNYINSKSTRVKRERSDLEVKEIILRVFNRRGYKKGSRSIKMVLENEFKIIYSLKRIRRIMRKYNIVCPHRQPNPYKQLAKATKEHRTVPNSLERNFKQDIPGKVLLTDITYLRHNGKDMAYLSTILDASTGEILAHHMSKRINLDIAIDTIERLLKQRKVKLTKDVIAHSDQWAHYTSPTYQKLLRKHGLGQSMSRRGNCWDNAPQESFFGHLKDSIDFDACRSFEDLKANVGNYITYYNNYRYQWGLKKMTPVQYRNHLLCS